MVATALVASILVTLVIMAFLSVMAVMLIMLTKSITIDWLEVMTCFTNQAISTMVPDQVTVRGGFAPAHGGHPPRDYLQGSTHSHGGHSTTQSTPSTSNGHGHPSTSNGHGTPSTSSGGGHSTPYTRHGIHGFAGTLNVPSNKGWGDPNFVGYHGIPVGYGHNAHSVDKFNDKLMVKALPPAHQLGHFHDHTRENKCVSPFCTHGFSADGGHPPRRFGDPPSSHHDTRH